MKNSVAIDLVKNQVTLDDGSVKVIDNYIFELEDRLIKIHKALEDYGDVDPNAQYMILGETLFEIMDILEGK